MTITIAAPTTKILYKLMEKYLLDSESLFQAAGIKKEDLNDINKRISYETMQGLWEQASELINDPCFGITGVEIWHPSDLNALGYAWLTSSTLRTALDRFHRFLEIATGFYRLNLDETETGYELIFDFKDKESLNMAQADASMAIVMEMCRVNLKNSLSPVSVSVTHPQPPCHNKYFSYYGCPVYFTQNSNKIILPLEAIDIPLFNSDPNLAFINDKAIIEYLSRLNKDDIVQQVKKLITEQLASSINSEQVAQSLNMSERSMHRRLNEKGTTFKKIMQDVRIELSKLYIRNNQFNITEIAFQLGFSDSSSFSRAFKRWTGTSPAGYRNTN